MGDALSHFQQSIGQEHHALEVSRTVFKLSTEVALEALIAFQELVLLRAYNECGNSENGGLPCSCDDIIAYDLIDRKAEKIFETIDASYRRVLEARLLPMKVS